MINFNKTLIELQKDYYAHVKNVAKDVARRAGVRKGKKYTKEFRDTVVKCIKANIAQDKYVTEQDLAKSILLMSSSRHFGVEDCFLQESNWHDSNYTLIIDNRRAFYTMLVDVESCLILENYFSKGFITNFKLNFDF